MPMDSLTNAGTSLLDEIVPSSSERGAFWLDEAEGVIGWPEFHAKDGKVYTRIWTQGDARVTPRVLTETLTNATGTTNRERQAMLYALRLMLQHQPRPVMLVAAADQEGKPGWRFMPALIAKRSACSS